MSNIPPHDLIRLRHMLQAAQKARFFVHMRERSDLESDEMLALAVTRLLEIMGEAAARVSVEVKTLHPAIPWGEIAGTRKRLIHGYFNTDLDIVWVIVQKDLPPLISKLAAIIDDEIDSSYADEEDSK